MKRLAALPFALLLIAPPAISLAHAEVLSLKWDNDLLAGEDGHYTNGLEFAWGFIADEQHWTQRFSRAIPLWSGDASAVSYRFGQQMYTPEKIDVRALQPDDRPYAGYLYAGLSLYKRHQSGAVRVAESLGFDVGIVGPAAGAKPIQRGVHEVTGSDRPEGWGNQLGNEPILSLTYQRAWWLHHGLGDGLAFEYGPNLGFAVGNLYDYLSLGLGVRIGNRLDGLFATPGNAPYSSFEPLFTTGPGLGWYLFAGANGRFMAHNLLLDGNTFESSHSVDRRSWVNDLTLGGALTFDSWNLALTLTNRSREFEGQDGDDTLGNLTLSTWLR
ncbi:lipid A deacylase LpxR family protein [Halotalea alkalilenta]|uniref:Lipid A deacylase LpxR family protein n=1 Tax=Halotalea alkalilenta TaxID=376489 RepID=A0A172YHG4_9GAMM|nr:lipid A deacylase LpxR family protein [Halotalea alkalilenta]ANF58684.1 hypothetical protein A5892_15440 [Halotalea alkalilenta]